MRFEPKAKLAFAHILAKPCTVALDEVSWKRFTDFGFEESCSPNSSSPYIGWVPKAFAVPKQCSCMLKTQKSHPKFVTSVHHDGCIHQRDILSTCINPLTCLPITTGNVCPDLELLWQSVLTVHYSLYIEKGACVLPAQVVCLTLMNSRHTIIIHGWVLMIVRGKLSG